MMYSHRVMSLALIAVLASAASAAAVELVRGGRPVATVVVLPEEAGQRRGWDDRQAAAVLVDWVKKMTDAELPIVEAAPAEGPAVFIGAAAISAGLRLDDIRSPSQEGLRIRSQGDRLLVAGQSPHATVKAVCRLLEHFGCRYFVDHPVGEVYPRVKSLKADALDITELPGFPYRSIWGSQWSGMTLWKVWNGAGGWDMKMGHAWGNYVSRDLFAEHPEYFQLRDGERRPSDWYCTSNPGLRKAFAQGVIRAIEGGATHPSLSPPDGRGYCECADCRRQDDPDSIEPSTGHVNITNRYVDFYQAVAAEVGKAHPNSVLSFYCYADYTQAPTSGIKLRDNLCAWIAPIRYCRFHRIGHPGCPSRTQLEELLDGWAAAVQKIGYRTYNYNLAECLVPFSMLSVWKHDIPYLHERGCIGMNLETLANWQIYGPHIYLSIRLSYDPQADADQIMDDYFRHFYGPKAGPPMKEYWLTIDRAFDELPSHAGSFYAVHLVYTPERLRQLRELISRAGEAAKDDAAYAARVQMASEGLRNAEQYEEIRTAINRGDFQRALRVYNQLLARSEENQRSGLGNHYTVGYLKRFVGGHVEAGAAATAAPNQRLAVLPDRWRLAYDDADEGLAAGYSRTDFDDSEWLEVATYSNTLDAQGLPDRQTIQWYRTTLNIADPAGKLALFFTEVDGDAAVYVNGKPVGGSERKRVPFTVDVSRAVTAGPNVVAVRVDHSVITELYLGGILRPVLLIRQAP